MSRIIQRSLREVPDTAVSGEGIWLHLRNGKSVIDGSAGAAVACLGHGNRRVAEAIGAQAGRLAYAHTGFFTSEPAEALADLLLADEPGGLTHAYFVSSGSEAMEAAIKMARQYFIEIGHRRDRKDASAVLSSGASARRQSGNVFRHCSFRVSKPPLPSQPVRGR